ncbi:MAG: hypothetical protein EA377_00540 [Phycisphaerales bacterium]|nr:MAG: hypothetical protein EA377_00540 [Phycisphaerales bacterium]
MPTDAIILFAICGAVLLGLALLPALPSWWHARTSGHPVPVKNLLMMRLRKIKPSVVIRSYIKAQEAALPIQLGELEDHVLAGGCVTRCVDAMIEARSRGLEVDWYTITCFDLAGRDPLDALSRAAATAHAGD